MENGQLEAFWKAYIKLAGRDSGASGADAASANQPVSMSREQVRTVGVLAQLAETNVKLGVARVKTHDELLRRDKTQAN